jgi:hypothetical protein
VRTTFRYFETKEETILGPMAEIGLSQQCPSRTRTKKPLSQRWHSFPQCGLTGDRDLVAAAMAACVTLTDPDQPATAHIDRTLRAALAARLQGQQEALHRSTATTAPSIRQA